MAEKRKRLPQFTSPTGVFRFPKLTEPDKGNDKFPKPDGEFSVQLLLQKDSKAASDLIKLLTPTYEEALDEAKARFAELPVATRKKLGKPSANALFTDVYDKETEEATGEIFFKFAMKASGEYKRGPKEGQRWSRKPVIFDAKGGRIMDPPAIWGGTKGKVAFEAGGYFIPGTGAAGLKLSLVGVQIIDLVTQGERSAESLGFKAEDEGYAHEAPAPVVEAPALEGVDDGSGDF